MQYLRDRQVSVPPVPASSALTSAVPADWYKPDHSIVASLIVGNVGFVGISTGSGFSQVDVRVDRACGSQYSSSTVPPLYAQVATKFFPVISAILFSYSFYDLSMRTR